MIRPWLLIFAGKAGSGKTTVSRKVAQTTHFAYFDYDTLVQPFLEEIEKRSGSDKVSRIDFYRQWRIQSYRTLFNPVIENLQLGNDVILSAPLSEELKDSEFPETLKREVGLPFSLLLCHLQPPIDLHYQMIVDRGSRRDEELLDDKRKFNDICRVVESSWDVPTLVLDTGDSDLNYEIVLTKINAL
ncbi:hypothetical protein SDC9_124274 [bioreactor metagenome]|uniref:Shikimate kinase n=1 Tax=bioreactor metagenome TaxID=1076179 RepID=A0A645CK21_9ZZZZ|nr:hypothetical protein [Bacilli bacterium]